MTCEIIAYRLFHSTALAANGKNQYGVTRLDGLRWSRTVSCKNYTKAFERRKQASSRRLRDVQTVTHGIFNHRSMEKDKLSILDVCGAYGQKDIEKLDRPEINKPARDNDGRLAD